MSSDKGPKNIYAREHKLCYQLLLPLYRALKKIATRQSEQSRECLQVEWLLFSSMKMHNTLSEVV